MVLLHPKKTFATNPPEADIPVKSAFDAVDGAHSAASKCHRVVATAIAVMNTLPCQD
jgi:hypothetical protein